MTDAPPDGATRSEAIARLRTEIARIEAAGSTTAGGTGAPAPGPVPLGIAAIDGHLPGGGLAASAVHEIVAGDGGMAATGFALALLARLSAHRPGRSWLWCGRGAPLYGPAFAAFGLDPAAGLVVRGASDREALWAMEEGLACGGLAAVIGEVGRLDAGAGRRLALAAREGGMTALLLRGPEAEGRPSLAATRWRVRGLPLGAPPPGARDDGGGAEGWAWRLDLLHGRGGALPRGWRVLWRPAASDTPSTLALWERSDGDRDEGGGAAPAAGAMPLAAPFRGRADPQGPRGSRDEAA